MVYRHTIDATSYVFADLRELLAKATPPRSGDRLAGIAADSAEQMIAARMALADVPLTQFLQETVIPYEDDEVTRLIIDSHDAPRFCADRLAHGRRLPRFPAVGCRDLRRADAARSRGITPEMAAAVSKLMRNQDLILAAKKCQVTSAFRNTIGLSRPHERAAAAQPSLRRCQGHHRLDPRRTCCSARAMPASASTRPATIPP